MLSKHKTDTANLQPSVNNKNHGLEISDIWTIASTFCTLENKNMSNEKISIRFFNDREVRAVWDEANTKWWFSVLDIVGVLNEESDYAKIRNYWKYLKAKLKKENNELVSNTN